MASLCFYFHVHQPYRVKKYKVFDVGSGQEYFDAKDDTDLNNEKVFHKVAQKCYLPTNALLLDLLKHHPEFRFAFSITGTLMEQLEEYSPEVLQSFKRLIDTGRVEIVSETYYHSLSFLYSKPEFKSQVDMHTKKIKELFGVDQPNVFRNTELIYNNDLAYYVQKIGYKGILAEGADHILGWRSPNFLYHPVGNDKIKLLLKNYKLSDDIAFRFSSKEWKEHPLTVDKYVDWINQVNGNGEVVNLFMDYETFGEHQWEDTGIFDFMRHLPYEFLKNPDNDFVTPSEAIERYPARADVDMPDYVSWADVERDLSAWLSNAMQHDAINKLYSIENRVKNSGNEKLLDDWRKLTTSDHFYYMCTKWFADGDVHAYFSPYESPYDAFRHYMNVLKDVEFRLVTA